MSTLLVSTCRRPPRIHAETGVGGERCCVFLPRRACAGEISALSRGKGMWTRKICRAGGKQNERENGPGRLPGKDISGGLGVGARCQWRATKFRRNPGPFERMIGHNKGAECSFIFVLTWNLMIPLTRQSRIAASTAVTSGTVHTKYPISYFVCTNGSDRMR
jgi:hypothetical protein